MTKKNMELLADFKKSNKERKARLLAKAGFKTQEDYFKHLGVKEKKSAKAVKKPVPFKVAKKVKVVKSTESDSVKTDYVIAFDTTGSMSSYIESVKKHVVELIEKLFSNTKDLRIKIVAFGDYCDMVSASNFGKAYQESQITDNKEELITFVKRAQNTSGGDGDEFYELVIKKINEETPWRSGAKKAVLLIGDAPCHGIGYSYSNFVHNNKIDWKVEAANAKTLGIQYDTLMIAHYDWYKTLSKITGGVSMNFKNANKISEVIEGSIYARSSKKAFTASYTSAVESGDTELIGAYKSMSTLTED